VFTFLAPCIVAIVAVAPWIAKRIFQGNSGVSNAARGRFRELLTQTELFVNRDDPELSGRRIFHAVAFGPTYHPLHLLLFPSLIALVAPVNRLYPYVFLAFVFSFFLLVWGNVSPRWQELNTYIERWFLRGTPLLISSFVIVIAILRLVQFDYVSTILDAAPFGTVFGLVVMNYVLFWLVEYWMSRVAAGQLLSVLGPTTDEVHIAYEPTFQQPNQNHPVRVRRPGRFLVSHGTGRFVAVGTVGPLDGPVHPPQPVRAFQTYYLMELFSRLGDGAGDPQHHEDVADINERTGIYFFWLNSLLLLVMLGFLIFVVVEHYTNNAIDPVVAVQATQPPERLVDLSGLLRQQGEPVRPAIVVVSSGGGTRAALYTASVLYGLHRLGVDRDIVLVSGVSGGGVALAYFAANRDVWTEQNQSGQARLCPEKPDVKRPVEAEWDCFTKGVTQPFIEDVLNGATEWRIFRTTALSELLAESFQRHLFPLGDTLGSLNTPALILNSTVVSQPDDESDALMRTIDPAKTCEEAEQTFNLMAGGRLIFTNLRDTDAFPRRKASIPDVRLPYQIVQDPHVPLASAAALNADFPPVFPTARVRIRNDGTGACPYRSYYVTDGGAEENLGLISALYALESALAKIPNDIRVRPIHVVIAEASAITYDYNQDRGVSALFGGSSERLAGGLTGALIEKVDQLLQRLNGAESSIQYHYLGLPLAFRARGGFGTHWMYAKVYHLNDPRPRTTAWSNYLPFARFRQGKAAVSREELEALWLALHDPDQPFCDRGSFNSNDADKVKTWVCGSPRDGPSGRDLHMENWKELVDELRPYRKP
jgi:hypothetical protein